ncbi:hypothetical protein PG985_009691 [Apiospora marii]|uniref:uncharacterized protein n=1 Tax=Apiospora marii TaxID=335849 RepID=UPI00312CF7F0
MIDQYKHAPLQSGSIRLLDLLPSSRPEAPVRCRIRHVKFAKAQSAYEALSYVWGAAEGSCAINCDGGELLLKQLRRKYRIRALWIDAICIDQTAAGEPERNEQIKNMGQVYANASTVLVWLGPESLPHATTMDLLHDELTHGTDQELAFARRCDILFGSKRISWRHLRALMIVCDITNNVSDHDLHFEVGPMYERIRFREGARRLVKSQGKFGHNNNDDFFPDCDDRRRAFLTSMTGLESKLPHDKLYGLYPILRLLSIDLPEPDYSASIVKVAQDFTRAAVASLGTLDVITSGLPNEDPVMPSWIPRNLTNPKPEAWAR